MCPPKKLCVPPPPICNCFLRACSVCLIICMLCNFSCVCRLLILFSKSSFQEYQQCQTVGIQIRPDILSGLIWVQTVYNGYKRRQQRSPLARNNCSSNCRRLVTASLCIIHDFYNSAIGTGVDANRSSHRIEMCMLLTIVHTYHIS